MAAARRLVAPRDACSRHTPAQTTREGPRRARTTAHAATHDAGAAHTPLRAAVPHDGGAHRSIEESRSRRARANLARLHVHEIAPPARGVREIARDRARSHLPPEVSTCQLDAPAWRASSHGTFLIWQVCVTAQIWTADLSRKLERAQLLFERARFLQEGATGPIEAQQVRRPPSGLRVPILASCCS